MCGPAGSHRLAISWQPDPAGRSWHDCTPWTQISTNRVRRVGRLTHAVRRATVAQL